jgi:hypothetical protein
MIVDDCKRAQLYTPSCPSCVQGRPAFAGMRAADIRATVLAGMRPPLPSTLHPDIAHVISSCWAQEADARPPFAAVLQRLEAVQRALHDTMTTTAGAQTTTWAGRYWAM